MPLFVRSTHAPLERLAEALFAFASTPYQLETPVESRTIDLSSTLPTSDLIEFRRRLGRSARSTFEFVERLCERFHRTLTLIIDQAEEVLTLSEGRDQTESKEFFAFLEMIQEEPMSFKLIISIRTEYYGRFAALMSTAPFGHSSLQQFLLEDLSEDGLVRAIRRPTLREPVGEFGVPYNIYGFEYEPGVAEEIARDLTSTVKKGGMLPVMQIVCSSLYRQTQRPEKGWVITNADYNAVGSVERRVGDHLDEALRECYGGRGGIEGVDDEVAKWKLVLFGLVHESADGTVTTELKPKGELRKLAVHQGLSPRFDHVVDYLSSDRARILRPTELVNVVTGEKIQCFSLGHD